MTAVISVPVAPSFTALIDARDLALVGRYRWRALFGHNGKIYAYTRGAMYMHRLIAEPPEGYETDHINGNGLDNRRSNLRPATRSQNKANMGKPKRPDGSDHSSRYKGVSWDKSRGKWQAKIQIAGRHRNLGRFDSEVAAAAAYDTAALAAWGEFAAINLASVEA